MRRQTEINYEMKLLSSLEKVFQAETPVYRPECLVLSALWDETVSFQAAYTGDCFMRERLEVRVVSELEKWVRVRTVEQVPVGRATNVIVDDNYLKTTPGMYPDLLRDLPEDHKVIVCSHQWRSLWVDVEVTEEIPAGDYEIEIQLLKEGEIVCSAKMKLHVVGVTLPKQEIMHTEWMHARLPGGLLSCGGVLGGTLADPGKFLCRVCKAGRKYDVGAAVYLPSGYGCGAGADHDPACGCRSKRRPVYLWI